MALTRTAPSVLKPTWWLTNLHYFIFMMRELSAVFIALFLFQFMQIPGHLLIHADTWAECHDWFMKPGVIAFNTVALLFAVLHTVTFFQAGAVIMPMKIGKNPVPAAAMVGGNLAGCVALTVGLIWLLVKM